MIICFLPRCSPLWLILFVWRGFMWLVYVQPALGLEESCRRWAHEEKRHAGFRSAAHTRFVSACVCECVCVCVHSTCELCPNLITLPLVNLLQLRWIIAVWSDGKIPSFVFEAHISLCQNFLIFLCCKQDFWIYSFLIHSQWRECLFWCSVSKNNKTAIAALSEKHCQVISSSQCNFKAYVCLSERPDGCYSLFTRACRSR